MLSLVAYAAADALAAEKECLAGDSACDASLQDVEMLEEEEAKAMRTELLQVKVAHPKAPPAPEAEISAAAVAWLQTKAQKDFHALESYAKLRVDSPAWC